MTEKILEKLPEAGDILKRLGQSNAQEAEYFVRRIQAAQDDDADQSEITNLLLYIQTNINQAYFAKFPQQESERIFTEIFKFLLFAASHNASNIRLTSYRSTGLFLLKITPYYTRSMWKIFSDVAMQSTIDIKSSSILASSFAFISNEIPLHTLEKFCDTTPIFHHFTISDPIFSEHLASIISKLKRMGLEWMQTLLHSFLTLIQMKNERFLFKSIAAIVTHYPNVLMKEVIEFIMNEEEPSKFIPIISFILSSVNNIDTANLDLSGIALVVLNILKDHANHIQQEIDSSFQILGVSSNSFSVVYEIKNENLLGITVKTALQADHCDLDITKYRTIPAFYQMKLPLEILRPTPEDGSLIAQAKIITLGHIALDNQEEYLKILIDSINLTTDDRSAPVCASLALCINKLIPNLLLSQLFAQIVFQKQQSWYKSFNIMNLIDEVSANTVENLLGPNGIKKVINILYDLSFNPNDKVYKQSPVVLSKFIRSKDLEYLFTKVSSNIDYFDLTAFRRSINLLTVVIKNHPEVETKYYSFIIMCILEGLENFKGDITLVADIFNFLSLFDLSVLSSVQQTQIANYALDIAAASLMMLNGQKPEFGSSAASEIQVALEQDLATKNFDIMNGTDVTQENFLSNLYAVLKLFLALPTECCYLPHQLNLANSLLKIFPQESAKLYEKCWKSMTEQEHFTILNSISPSLATMKDFGAIAVWAHLLLTKLPDSASRFVQARDVLHKLSYYAIQHLEIVPDGVLFVFVRYECTVVADINAIVPLISQMPQNRRDRMLYKLYNDYPDAYRRLMGNTTPPIIIEEINSMRSRPNLNIQYNVDFKFDYTLDLNCPHIVTQLKNNTFEFNQQILQMLALHYCRFSNNVALRVLLNYASRAKILLDFDPNYVPHSLLSMVIQYMRIIKSPKGPDFVNKSLSLSHSREVSITSASVIQSSFIKEVNKDGIKKKGITKVLYAISKVALPQKDVFQFVLDCLDPEARPKRFLTALTLATVACHLIPKIDPVWVDNIVRKLQSMQDLNVSVLVRFVSAATSKIMTSQTLFDFLKNKVADWAGQRTVESCIAYTALLPLETNQKLLEKTMNDNTQNYISAINPSLFSNGVKYLNACITKSKDGVADSLIKNIKLQTIMQRYTEFEKLPFIPENVVLFYSNIMTRPALVQYQKTLLKSFESIMPSPASAAFPAMSVIVPKMIAIGDGDFAKRALAFSDKLNTKPASLFLMRCQIQIIREEASKMKSFDTFILDMATEFLTRAHKFDGPYMSDILFEYISFITESLGFTDGVQFVVLQFHKYIPRFTSLFVALARLYNKVDEEKKSLILSLLPTVLVTKAHRVAIQCIGNKQKMVEALKLATYEYDCPQSDAIIQKLSTM